MSGNQKAQILRSTSILGGATAASLVISVVRTKVLAILLGPAGIGLLGVFTTVLGLGTAVFGMALDTSGVRQIAGARHDADRLRISRWGLWTFGLVAALLAFAIFWFLRRDIAQLAVGNTSYRGSIVLIGLGVAVSIASLIQLALIQGYQRIGDLARIRLLAALASLFASVLAVYLWRIQGVIFAALSLPVATGLVAMPFLRRLPATGMLPVPALKNFRSEWQTLVVLGSAVTATAALGTISQVATRSLLTQRLGLEAAGLFQASFSLSSLNLGLVLAAMVPDYYPRVSAAAEQRQQLGPILNGQIHVGMVLAGPALIAIATMAPILLQTLYTGEFTKAALLLRLQLTSDALRVVGWSVGFLLLARRRTLAYVLLELVFAGVFLPLLWMTVPILGVAGAGFSYLAGYVASVLLAIAMVRHEGTGVDRTNTAVIIALVCALTAIAALSLVNERAAMLGGGTAFLIATMYSVREIARIGPAFIPARILVELRRLARIYP